MDPFKADAEGYLASRKSRAGHRAESRRHEKVRPMNQPDSIRQEICFTSRVQTFFSQLPEIGTQIAFSFAILTCEQIICFTRQG